MDICGDPPGINTLKMYKDVMVASQIMELKQGGDFVKYLNKIPFGFPGAKYRGEMHLPGYSFVGPSTSLKDRLDENDQSYEHSKPINRVDEAAMYHDIAYRDTKDDLKKKHEADKILIDRLNNFQSPTFRERLGGFLAKNALRAKVKLGLGVNGETEELFKKIVKP